MKKILLLLGFMLCANIIFAQSVSTGINDIDISLRSWK